MHILSREEMYAFDKFTIEKIGIHGKQLMENAGKKCSNFIQENLLENNSKISIFCGSGNNGGDGFVIARYLKQWNPKIYLLGNPEKMSSETYDNYQLCVNLGIQTTQLVNIEQIENLRMNDLIIDAIFGVGLKGAVRGFAAEVITEINESQKPVIAIDIASGIDANTGNAKLAVMAKYTLTMAAFKRGHFLEDGKKYSGKVLVIDIGIPKELFLKFPPNSELITENNVKYPIRFSLSHKGNYGRIGIIAGSPGFSGAAILASRSALRSGAGLITLFHPAGMEAIFETQLLEVMTHSLPVLRERKSNSLESEEFAKFLDKLNLMDAILIGPGLGISEHSKKILQFILEKWNKPLVIDADSLNILADNKEMLNLLAGKEIILTPHIGEFSKLTGNSISKILSDPLAELEAFVNKFKCMVLLKSSTTIFYDGKKFLFDTSGNDGLSTGGSGDVLAGIIISFIGQKSKLTDSAIAASYLLGKTAEKIAKIRKPASIIPSDIIEEIFKY